MTMTEQELTEINARFSAEAQYINDSDPGQGSPYFEDEGYDTEEDKDYESERRVNWECWQDDMEEVSARTLRLFRNHMVEGGLYIVNDYMSGEALASMGILTFLEEMPTPDEWQNCGVSPWNSVFVFLRADGQKLYVTWSEPWSDELVDKECYTLFDVDDHVFRRVDLFVRIG